MMHNIIAKLMPEEWWVEIRHREPWQIHTHKHSASQTLSEIEDHIIRDWPNYELLRVGTYKEIRRYTPNETDT
jgi:hypothetical protein